MTHQTWLEQPYQERYAREDAFLEFCEETDTDPDEPSADQLFQDWLDEQADIAAERIAEARYEERHL